MQELPIRRAGAPPLSRQFWVIVHRWAGLTMAAFLIVAGATGAVLPFQESLLLASRPSLSRAAPPAPGARPLDGITLAERVEQQTGGVVSYIPLEIPRDHVAILFVAARAGAPPFAWDALWADSYTGKVRLTYRWGGLRDGVVNIVPFLYSLHYGIVAGAWGMWAFGVAALVWTVDCFVGLFLTFPARRVVSRAPRRGWLARWAPAWRIRRAAGYKLHFDLHRAGGLWLWPLLFVFAWSAVGLTLPQVARPVMQALGASAAFAPPPLETPLARPPITRREAVARGDAEFARLTRTSGIRFIALSGLSYDAGTGFYALRARTSLDVADEGGASTLWIDGRTGRVARFERPLGTTAADGFMGWLYLLHMAQVFGLPYRIAVSIIGLLVVALSVTGIMIWSRKRAARLLHRGRARTDQPFRQAITAVTPVIVSSTSRTLTESMPAARTGSSLPPG